MIYTGTVSILIGASFASTVIDPPERDGYVNEIDDMQWFVEESAPYPGGEAVLGASIKIPGRTTFDQRDRFASDILFSGLAHPWTQGAPQTNSGFMVEDPYFQTQIQLMAGLAIPGSTVSSTPIVVHYRMQASEVRLTDKIRNAINQRCYS